MGAPQGLPPELAMMDPAMGGGAPPMPGMPPEAAAMGMGAPSEGDMLRMIFDQTVGGLESQQAQISGSFDMLLEALMQVAGATAPPDPAMLAPMEGVPMGAGPAPGGAPVGPPQTEADMLAGML